MYARNQFEVRFRVVVHPVLPDWCGVGNYAQRCLGGDAVDNSGAGVRSPAWLAALGPFGIPIYHSRCRFERWYLSDAYAPEISLRGGVNAASSEQFATSLAALLQPIDRRV